MKLSSLVALALIAAPAAAQTLLTHDGLNATVVEVAGPPDPLFCGYPKGPIKAQFQTQGAFACALPGIVDPLLALAGDITVDRPKDEVWVSDGDRIASYDAQGVALQSFGLPAGLLFGTVRGLGFDGLAGTLWVTDGNRALEVSPPTVTCGDPTIVSGPIPLPALGPTPALVTDIDFDPATGTLWLCDGQGFVGNVTTAGLLLSSFQAAPGPCALTTPLTGIAVDSSSPNPGTLFVTDGGTVASLEDTGVVAGASFGQPFQCFQLPTASRSTGLAFSSRPIPFGDGGGVLAAPEIGAVGQAVLSTQNLAITLAGAQPGSVALLPFSLDPACPELSFATVPVLIFPVAFGLFSSPVDAQGEAAVPILIPPTGTPGLEVFYQWYVLPPGPSPDGPPILSSGAGSMRVGFG